MERKKVRMKRDGEKRKKKKKQKENVVWRK